MGQAQINVRTRACSGTFIARTKQAALTHNVIDWGQNSNNVPGKNPVGIFEEKGANNFF